MSFDGSDVASTEDSNDDGFQRLDSFPRTAASNDIVSNDDGESDDDSSFVGSLSTTDAIDLSSGQLQGPEKLMDFSSQISGLSITSLSLSGNNFVDPSEKQKYNDDRFSNRGPLALAAALADHQTVTSVDVSENSLGAKGQSGIVALARASGMGVIKVLDVGNNQMLGPKGNRYDGIRAIAKAVETASGTALAELTLSQNGLHASAVCFLGVSLVDTTLEHLDLSGNSVGVDSLGRRSNAGMSSLLTPFASDRCNLRSLNLSENFLGNEECTMLASVLESMFDLRELDLSFNDIHAVGARHLAAGEEEKRRG